MGKIKSAGSLNWGFTADGYHQWQFVELSYDIAADTIII
jgi:hypothetical protein